MLELLRTMYRYNAWANERVLDAAARLSPAQYRDDGGASFGCVHDTLVHIMGAQWIFLSRWHGTSPSAFPDPAQFTDLAALRKRWRAVEEETRAFVAGLTAADPARVIAYLHRQGERWAYPLWQQMIHQVNHATQHRSEAAMLLTKHGHSPGGLDLLYFVDVEAAGST